MNGDILGPILFILSELRLIEKHPQGPLFTYNNDKLT